MREKLGPTSPEAKAKREALDALRAQPNDETLSRALEAGVELPDDPRTLMTLLDSKNEALLVPVLRALLALIEGGKKLNRMLLVQKLDALKNRVSEDDVLELIAIVRAALD